MLKTNTGRLRLALATASAAAVFGISPARADLVLTLNDPFSGSYSAFAQEAGTIDISVVNSDEVLVTVTSTLVASDHTAYPNQYISGVALGFEGTGTISVTNYKINGSGAAAPSNVYTAATNPPSGQGADASGDYGLILESFGSSEFIPGDTLTFDVSDTSGITPAEFDNKSTGGADGAYFAAVDFIGILGTANEWVGAAPDGASTVCLLGSALLALAGLRRFLCAS
ncbi:MAG: hypothetical protein ABSA05_11340 [Opitutaceae bacterium]|jgi:hypothetical protein